MENGTAGTSDQHDASAPSDRPKGSGLTATLLPTGVCIVILLVLKTVQQAYIDGLPLFTQGLYGWADGTVGTYIGLISLSMLPVNVAVGAVSGKLSDRVLNAACLALALVGCCQLMKGGFPQWNYFVGGVVVFASTIVLEGAAMSLMSKVSPMRFCRPCRQWYSSGCEALHLFVDLCQNEVRHLMAVTGQQGC